MAEEPAHDEMRAIQFFDLIFGGLANYHYIGTVVRWASEKATGRAMAVLEETKKDGTVIGNESGSGTVSVNVKAMTRITAALEVERYSEEETPPL